ncbi:MAG: YqaA family protein [Legionellaceae bacterium]
MNKFFVMKSTSSGPVNGLECKIAGVNGTLSSFGGDQLTNYPGSSPSGALVLNEWNLVALVWDSVAKTVRTFVLNSATVLAGVAQASSTAVSAAYSTDVPDLATYDKVCQLFDAYGVWIVFLAGFSPIPYKVFTVAAGALQMAFFPFVVASVIGRGLRFFLVSGLLFFMGEGLEKHLRRFIDVIGWAVVFMAVVAYLIIKWIH